VLIDPPPTLANIGGKALQLDRLKTRFALPEYFVLQFAHTEELEDPKVESRIIAECEARGFERMAVRSSAGCEDSVDASFAGMFDTVLSGTSRTVVSAIARVLDSVRSPRVREYCDAQGIAVESIQMSVIIQRLVVGRVSGVCFSRMPGDTECLLIEACYGLGEVLVSGLTAPDSYLVDRKTRDILKGSIGYQKVMIDGQHGEELVAVPFHRRNARKLSDEEIGHVAAISISIEEYLQFESADVEWTFEGGKLYVLQARPWSGFRSHSRHGQGIYK